MQMQSMFSVQGTGSQIRSLATNIISRRRLSKLGTRVIRPTTSSHLRVMATVRSPYRTVTLLSATDE